MGSVTPTRHGAGAAGKNATRTLDGEALLHEYRSTADRAIFAELICRYGPGLYAYLYRRCGDAETAEELFAATFRQVRLQCQEFGEEGKLRPWLYEIAAGEATAARRRKRRRPSPDGKAHRRKGHFRASVHHAEYVT
jgi:DNA-directed RNA polymerase specialized sigma24 family protein